MSRPLLTVEQVADFLRVEPNTIYRWCRQGHLTGIKIGKEWRISSKDLDRFIESRRTGGHVASLETIFTGYLTPPEHVLVMMTDPDGVYQLEVSFFQAGLRQGRSLYKGCWWQHPDEVRRRFAAIGLPVEELERDGRLTIEDFRPLYQARGSEAVYEAWVERANALHQTVFWGAGSHLINDWDGNYDALNAFEGGLHEVLRTLPVVALCCCVVAPAEVGATAALINLAAHHSGSLFIAQDNAVMMRPVRFQT